MTSFKAYYNASGSIGPALTKVESEEVANIKCFTGDDAAAVALTGDLNCVTVPLANDLFQFRNKAVITCSNPVTMIPATGVENCVLVDNVWSYGGAYVSQDQKRFRTLGSVIPGDVSDDMVSCLSASGTVVREGAANCWSYWLGSNATVGGVDSFVWLTTEGVSCGSDLSPVTGTENCQISKEIECNSSKLLRLSLAAD